MGIFRTKIFENKIFFQRIFDIFLNPGKNLKARFLVAKTYRSKNLGAKIR